MRSQHGQTLGLPVHVLPLFRTKCVLAFDVTLFFTKLYCRAASIFLFVSGNVRVKSQSVRNFAEIEGVVSDESV